MSLKEHVLAILEEYPEGAYVDDIHRVLPEYDRRYIQRVIYRLVHEGQVIRVDVEQVFTPRFWSTAVNRRCKYKLTNAE